MMDQNRLATWSSVGYNVDRSRSLSEALEASGLDYRVEPQPLFLADGRQIEDRAAMVREDGSKVYGIVSNKFEIVQNRDAFDFVDYMGDDVRFVRAGETSAGMVFIIAALPDVGILGDTFTPYVVFRNGFNGKVKISAAICPLRIVCQNQFNFVFQNTNNSVLIRHVANAHDKLLEARNTLQMTAGYMEELNTRAQALATMHVSVEKITDILFPMPTGEELEQMNAFKRDRLVRMREAFVAAHDADDNGNFRNTAWGMVNAYTDLMTHRDIAPMVDENRRIAATESRFMKTVFEPRSSFNAVLDAIELAA